MDIETIMLTPRQRNQIKAALTFWNAVAETSRVHPMEHPKVGRYFMGGLSSLTPEAIDDLITFFDNEFDLTTLVTMRDMAATLGADISIARLSTQAKRDGIQPIRFRGCSTGLYRPSDLIKSARIIRERDAQHEQKYLATETPPPTDSDKSV